LALLVAALSSVLRPTAALLWLAVGAVQLWRWRDTPGRAAHLVLAQVLPIGYGAPSWQVPKRVELTWSSPAMTFVLPSALAVAVGALVDRTGYGHWVLTPVRFLRFNVLENLSVFYGTHPWHWYATQGVPLVAGTLLWPAAVGVSAGRGVPAVRWLAGLAVWAVAAYSLLAHKEFRFIHPVVPLVAVLGGVGIAHLATAGRSAGPRRPAWWRRPRAVLTAVAATQLPLAAYLGLVHQRGVVDVAHWLRHRPAATAAQPWSAAFLMPCHSTPWQAFVHQPAAELEFVTCEPPTRCAQRACRGMTKDSACPAYVRLGAMVGRNAGATSLPATWTTRTGSSPIRWGSGTRGGRVLRRAGRGTM